MSTKSNLTTAKFYNQTAADEGDASRHSESALRATPALGAWERVAARLSLIVGAGVTVGVVILAIGYGSSLQQELKARSKKSSATSEWLERFSGVNVNDAFEKAMNDVSSSSNREWEDKFRSSPAYQFNNKGVNFSQMQKAMNAAPPTKPSRRTR